MALITDLKPGESLRIDGGRIVLTMLEKVGQRARLKIEAAKSVKIEKRVKSLDGVTTTDY